MLFKVFLLWEVSKLKRNSNSNHKNVVFIWINGVSSDKSEASRLLEMKNNSIEKIDQKKQFSRKRKTKIISMRWILKDEKEVRKRRGWKISGIRTAHIEARLVREHGSLEEPWMYRVGLVKEEMVMHRPGPTIHGIIWRRMPCQLAIVLHPECHTEPHRGRDFTKDEHSVHMKSCSAFPLWLLTNSKSYSFFFLS